MLSTASLLLPVFFAREFLGIDENVPLKDVATCTLYFSWAFLAVAIFSGIFFHFMSAKWARLAWEQPVGVFGIKVSDRFVERALEISLWTTVITFGLGLALVLGFLLTFSSDA